MLPQFLIEGWQLFSRYSIITLAKDLKMEFTTLKGMSARNLRYMHKFATLYCKITLFPYDKK